MYMRYMYMMYVLTVVVNKAPISKKVTVPND